MRIRLRNASDPSPRDPSIRTQWVTAKGRRRGRAGPMSLREACRRHCGRAERGRAKGVGTPSDQFGRENWLPPGLTRRRNAPARAVEFANRYPNHHAGCVRWGSLGECGVQGERGFRRGCLRRRGSGGPDVQESCGIIPLSLPFPFSLPQCPISVPQCRISRSLF